MSPPRNHSCFSSPPRAYFVVVVVVSQIICPVCIMTDYVLEMGIYLEIHCFPEKQKKTYECFSLAYDLEIPKDTKPGVL